MTEASSAAIESHVLGADGGPKEPLTSEDAVKREAGLTGGAVTGSDESVTTAAEEQDASKDVGKSEDLEKDEGNGVKVRHKWCVLAVSLRTRDVSEGSLVSPGRTIFDPFNFKPPPPPPASMDDAETIRISQANWLSEFTFCGSSERLSIHAKPSC